MRFRKGVLADTVDLNMPDEAQAGNATGNKTQKHIHVPTSKVKDTHTNTTTHTA